MARYRHGAYPGSRSTWRGRSRRPGGPGAVGGWTFLTNHGHALVALSRDGDLRVRDLAAAMLVTERTAQSIVNDLVDAGYVERSRVGNRSRYVVRADLPFRHPVERDHSVGKLLDVLTSKVEDG